MIFGVGWCVLRASRAAYATTAEADAKAMDGTIRIADEALWAAFRAWMAANASPLLVWSLHERHNNHDGLLQIFLSRNHRASPFWAMLEWIAENGPASFGLFYVHDDEDEVDDTPRGRGIPESYANVFRVHRIMNGRVQELADPFFGPIVPNLTPVHPYDRHMPDDGDHEKA